MLQSNMALRRPEHKSYSVKQVVNSNNGSGIVKRSLSNLISFRMKEHAYAYKQMLKIVNPGKFFVVESIVDLNNNAVIYDSEMNPTNLLLKIESEVENN